MSLDRIEARQEALETLHAQMFPKKPKTTQRVTQGPAVSVSQDDTVLIAKASQAKNGEKFAKLFSGDFRGAGFGSQSEADLSLCSSLYFWTGGDIARVDRIFRSSGLMRDKWDNPHFSDGKTYGQATTEACIGGVVYESNVFNPLAKYQRKIDRLTRGIR